MNDERWWWMLISESRIMIHSLFMILYWWLMNDDDKSSLRVGIPSWLKSELWMMMIHILIITEFLVIELSEEGPNKSKIL